jgi:hypothetical protein
VAVSIYSRPSSRNAAYFSRVRDLLKIRSIGDSSFRLKNDCTQDDPESSAGKFKLTTPAVKQTSLKQI